MNKSILKLFILHSILILSLLPFSSFANIVLTEFPDTLQLYARDVSTNEAIVSIVGSDDSGQLASIELNVYRESVLINSQTENLNYTAGIASFNLEYSIVAELANYTFELISNDINGIATIVKIATDVVAGDVFIIDGQSNAECRIRTTSAAAYQNDFIRVFSSGTQYSDQLLNTSKWFIGAVDGHRNVDGNTGQWGAKLAAEIISNHQIPVAIFNGAHGGTPVSFHQKNDADPFDLETNYGRLLYRLDYTNLTNAVRAIYWYQGESDANGSMLEQTYYDLWNELYQDWKADYPFAEQFYIHQIRLGCNGTPEKVVEIQSAQFQLAQDLADVQITTAKGIPFHTDNCHYDFIGGSEEIGNRIYQLTDRDIYNNSSLINIDAPQPALAYYSGTNQITVELKNKNDNYNFEIGTEQYFSFSDTSNSISSVSYDGAHTFQFNMFNPVSNLTSFTFYGFGGPGITTPSLKNAKNIGMVSFKDFPIVDCLSFNATEVITDIDCFGENNGEVEVSAIGGLLPFQIDWSNGLNSLIINNLSPTTYTYNLTDANGCYTSNSIVITEPTEISLSAFYIDESISGANDGVINLAVTGGIPPYSYNWSNGATWQDINNLAPGIYDVEVTDANNCTANYSVTILAGPLPCVSPSNILVENIQNTSATISWLADTNDLDYQVEFREQGSANWNTFSSNFSFAILNNLLVCTNYEVRVKANCPSAQTSSYSAIYTFETTGCIEPCATIQGLFSQNITSASAFLVWDIVPNASYTMFYRAVGNASWFSYPTQFPIAILFTLPACTDFEWYVEVNCANGQLSQPSPIENFSTIGAACKTTFQNNPIKNKGFKISPNPTNSFSIITLPSTTYSISKINLVAIDGKQLSESINFNAVGNEVLIDFTEVPSGIYQLHIITFNEILSQSIFIKNR